MNWIAIGAAGQIVAALAVVVSVIYLAVQIRSQTAESRLAATRDLASKRAEAVKQLASDDALIKSYLTAIRDYESLQGAERMKASLLFNLIMRNAEQEFIHKGTGHADDPYLESVDRVLARNIVSPGLQQWWATTGDLFNREFQRHVNQLIEKSDASVMNDAFILNSECDGAA